MIDLECPYCKNPQEVCRDDGDWYEEDVLHEMECSSCEKAFVFTTYISFTYDPRKADCLNGSDHKWKQINFYPNFWPDAKRCTDCGLERKGEIDKKEVEKLTN